MNAYLGKRVQPFGDAELYDACRRLADLVGKHRSITPLLAKLYAEQLARVSAKPSFSNQLPDNIPELMLGYLTTINRDRGPNDPGHEIVHRAAQVVAWECCRANLYASVAKKVNVLKSLSDASIDSGVLSYLENRLQVVHSIAPAQTHVEYGLDPVAEYLAAQWLLVINQTDDDWDKFLARIDGVIDDRHSSRDFVSAVWILLCIQILTECIEESHRGTLQANQQRCKWNCHSRRLKWSER